MKARSGKVFQKSSKLSLLKEKNISHLLNDYCSKHCIVRRDLKIAISGRSFEKKTFRISLQVFAVDYFEEMIFTPPFSHLNSKNWSLGAPHTGQTSGKMPSDT